MHFEQEVELELKDGRIENHLLQFTFDGDSDNYWILKTEVKDCDDYEVIVAAEEFTKENEDEIINAYEDWCGDQEEWWGEQY